MGKFLKLFNNHADYVTFSGGNFDRPNVSYCLDMQDVHYNPFIQPEETRLMVTYTVQNASNPTQLYYYYTEQGNEQHSVLGINIFDNVEIDGTEVSVSSLDTAQGAYQLSVGEHTVAYTLKDPTTIGFISDDNTGEPISVGAMFGECSAITNVRIPNSITTIGESAFYGCTGLTSITIPNNVTSIGNYAFQGCTSLTSVTIGSGVTSINDEIFSNCNSLTTIVITNTSILIEGCWGTNGTWHFPLDQATKNLLLSINSDIMCYIA